MDSALIWYGLWLLLIATVFWAAVWWWLPALFREREREHTDRAPGADGREPDGNEPGERRRGGSGSGSDSDSPS